MAVAAAEAAATTDSRVGELAAAGGRRRAAKLCGLWGAAAIVRLTLLLREAATGQAGAREAQAASAEQDMSPARPRPQPRGQEAVSNIADHDRAFVLHKRHSMGARQPASA